MYRKEQIDRIKGLIEQYLEIINSEKNKQNMKLWDRLGSWNRDKPRGVPANKRTVIPYTVSLDNSLWGRLFNTSLVDYYTDPYTQMELQLKMRMHHFNNIKDNTAFTEELYIWFGVTTELTLFGCEPVFFDHREGWIKEPIINEYQDLDRLSPPDFYKNKVMQKIHHFYEVMSEVSDGKLKVMFPDLARGPFCIAAHMRGLDRILIDAVIEPGFVHKLMRFIVDVHKAWSQERNRFVHDDRHKCKLFNDEVDCPTISPAIYDEVIFPYEKELAEFYGGVAYWHSCGNTTAFLNSIGKLPDLDLFHVGPWTSYKEADRVFKNNTALDICLHPMSDVLDADDEKMKDKLQDIIESCKHNNFSVRADTFMPYDELGTELGKIRAWSNIAAKYLNKI